LAGLPGAEGAPGFSRQPSRATAPPRWLSGPALPSPVDATVGASFARHRGLPGRPVPRLTSRCARWGRLCCGRLRPRESGRFRARRYRGFRAVPATCFRPLPAVRPVRLRRVHHGVRRAPLGCAWTYEAHWSGTPQQDSATPHDQGHSGCALSRSWSQAPAPTAWMPRLRSLPRAKPCDDSGNSSREVPPAGQVHSTSVEYARSRPCV